MSEVDQELRIARASCVIVLGKLEQLSDAKTAQYSTEGQPVRGFRPDRLRTRGTEALPLKGSRSFDSQLPGQVSLNGNGHAPSLHDSLFLHFRWRMQEAWNDAAELTELAGDATYEHTLRIGKAKVLRFATDDEAIDHMLRHFTGHSAASVARKMKAPQQSSSSAERWVRRHRALNGYDPETGEIRAAASERNRRIFEMSAQGLKQRMIADELGITQARVSQVLSGNK